MIELELQALALSRDGLLIEVGRLITENGFTLRRQRLAQDPHGVLLTMVVHGPPRQQRKLDAALDAYERIISFQLSPFVEGASRAHFAASRPVEPRPAAPPPPPSISAPAAAAPAPLPQPPVPPPAEVEDAATPGAAPLAPPIPMWEELAALAGTAQAAPAKASPAPQPTSAAGPSGPAPAPFVDVVPLGPDTVAVESMLATLEADYPHILTRLQTLAQAVDPAARESSLAAAGRGIGAWVSQREPGPAAGLALEDAIARVGLPALQALTPVVQQGRQVHIRDSPLCRDGRSGCQFYSSYLEALLAPVMGSQPPSIFPVCCRSFGADECVLALSD